MIGGKSAIGNRVSSAAATEFSSDRGNTISALDAQKHFNGESLGETLNKIADPNHVSNSRKVRGVGSADLGKDAFMTLLLAQMKHQDPTNPVKSHEMAAQLAQFTSLEKLQGIDDGIESLRKEIKPNQNLEALSFIGRSVLVDSSRINREDEVSSHNVRFNLSGDAVSLRAEIKNDKGEVVRKLEFKGLKAGKNDISWNGLLEDGSTAPKGEYTVNLQANSSNGSKLLVETKSEGLISGVNFTARGPLLMVGNQSLSFTDIRTVLDPNLAVAAKASEDSSSAASQVKSATPTQSPKKVEVKPEAKDENQNRVRVSTSDVNDAAMEQDLINQLSKSGVKAGMAAGT